MTEIRLNSRRTVFFLAAGIVFFAVCDLAVQWSRYRLGHGNLLGLYDLFDLDSEANLPSWFESLLFLIAAAQLYWIARVKKSASDRWAPYWKSLSFVFVVLSADEIVALHEKSIEPLRNLFHIHGGYLYFSWIILGAAFVLALGFFYFRFLMSLPGRIRRDFVIAAVLFLGGAIVTEAFGGRYFALHEKNNLSYNLLVVVEEVLEMTGLWYWIRSLFLVLRDHEPSQGWNLTLKPR